MTELCQADSQDVPLVSIITPAYKAEQTIENAIDSVLSQTYQCWEMIVVEDASPDNTAKIVQQMAVRDERIRLLRNETNLGVSKTRNRGIAAAKGVWIAFLDSDDMWAPDKLQKQLSLAAEKGCGFIFTGSRYVDQMGISLNHEYIPPATVNLKQYKKHNVISCASVMVKKNDLKGLVFEGENIREDYLMWLRLIARTQIACCVQEPLTIYRLSTDSRSSDKRKMIHQTYLVHRWNGDGVILSAYYATHHLLSAYFQKYRHLK